MINEKLGDLVYDYLETIDKPFKVTELLKAIGLEKTKQSEQEIHDMIQVTDYFVKEKNTFYPKHLFLKDVPIRIQPTEFETEKGILIPGYRMLPFHPFARYVDESTYLDGKTMVKTKTMGFTMPEILIYFSMMDLEKYPISNIEDILEHGAKLKIKVWDLKNFYKKNKFQPGDTIIVKPVEIQEGIFSIEYDSYDNYQRHIFEIGRIDREFLKTLKQVMKKDLAFPNVEKQLLYTYYFQRDKGFTTAGSALGPLLSEDPDIVFSPLPNGRTIFHFADQEIEDLAAFPKYEDYWEEEDNEEIDFDNIEGILRYIGNNNDLVVVHALLLDQIANQRRYNYKKIEDYLFDGLDEPYMPEELREHFKALVKQEHKELKKAFNPAYAFLPVTTAREKVLDAALLISRFLRSLDGMQVRLEDLPKQEMLQLSELDGALNNVLEELETSQLGERNDSGEMHRILKMVDRVTADLPVVFDVIRAKIRG
jgi:hypothetical protein